MADLTAAKRKKLKSTEFALPGEGEGPEGKGSGSYPIPDEAHGRLAMSMVAQHGTDDEKKKVRAAVKRKYPDIGHGSGALTNLGQKTLGQMQSKYGDAEGKKHFHAALDAGRLDRGRMMAGSSRR